MRFYSCGPTVYDHAHIGNLRAFIFADTLHRTLESAGFKVKHVMNITDINDKIIARSQRDYPNDEPNEAMQKLTKYYTKVFLDDIAQIGNDTNAILFVNATDHIDGMRQLVIDLQQKGFAYVADDGVYFSIDAYKKSGKKYGQLLTITSENTSEARIQNDEYDKATVHDFALWKTQKPGEPAWPFMLDGRKLDGRPGWHIECSVMSRAMLGQPFDIHTGGIDLLFPHHENEIAQSTAGNDNPVMASFFAHNEHLLVDGKKMAKSASNFYTLENIIEKGYDPLAFRLLILQSHYRSQAQFSIANLEAAQNRLQSIRAMADLQFQATGIEPWLNANTSFNAIQSEMQNDLNTPAALSILNELTTTAEERLISANELETFKDTLSKLDHVFGLQLSERRDISEAQKQLIEKRERARTDKNWAAADELRGQLSEQSIGVRDTAHGPIWFRK